MADPNEPKEDAVRVSVPPQPGAAPSETPLEKRDTGRINLPTRPPASSQVLPPPDSPVSPLRKDILSPLPATPSSSSAGPKKETARIATLPDPTSRWSVQMKRTQPLIDLPAVEAPRTALTVAVIDKIPKPLCWTLVGVSGAILIIQILNYLL